MQMRWAEYILETKGSPCPELRARTALHRELKRQPTDEEIALALTPDQKIIVSHEDIINAFKLGHLVSAQLLLRSEV